MEGADGIGLVARLPEGIENLFDTLVKTYGGRDILLNNVGKHMSGLFMWMTDKQWQQDLELFGVLEGSVPLARVGETQEAADPIAYLASERAQLRDRLRYQHGRWFLRRP